MTAPTASRPPAGMPPHLWELAKRDVRGAVPDAVRNAPDASTSAPRNVRAIARRAAVAGGTLGAAAAAAAFATPAVAATPVDLASFDGAVPPPGGPVPGGPLDGVTDLDGASGVGGAGGAGGTGGAAGGDHGVDASTGVEGSLADGPVSSGLGSTFQVSEGPAGAETTLTVSIFQDVTVIETADGMFQVDAYQFIVITDSDGNEYVFKEHFQVVVPDPPGQETDLIVHETGRVHIVENADGSFTPVSVDHGIEVFVGSDGDGRDEIGIRQDESVRITEHGRPDADDTTIQLTERARTDSDDLGDEAFTEIDQITRGPGSSGAPHPWSEHPGPGFDEVGGVTGTGGPGSTTTPATTTGTTSTGTTGTGTTGTGTTGTGTIGTGTTGTGTTGTGTTGTGTTGTGTTGTGTTGTGTTPPTPAAPVTTAVTTPVTTPVTAPATAAGTGVAAPTLAGSHTEPAAPLGSSLAPEPTIEVGWSGAPPAAESVARTELPDVPDDVFGGQPTSTPATTGPDASRPTGADTEDVRDAGQETGAFDRSDEDDDGTSGPADDGAAGNGATAPGDSGFEDAGLEASGDDGDDGGASGDGSSGSDGQADSALVG